MTHDELLGCLDELILRLRSDSGFSVPEVEELFERALVHHVLDATHGNVSKAAQLRGRHRNGLMRKMKKFGFTIKQWDRKGSRGAQKRKAYEAYAAANQPGIVTVDSMDHGVEERQTV